MTKLETIPVDHPGEYLREEMEERGWNQKDLAYILGVTDQSVNQLVNCRKGISPDMAKMLGEAFDVSAELFINLQSAYDLYKARKPEGGISKRASVLEHYPLRDMIKRGWLEDTEPALLETQMMRFFDVKDFSEVPHIAHAARKTHPLDDIPAPQLAWLFRVKQISEEIAVPAYSRAKLLDAVENLKQYLLSPTDIRHVPRILTEAGVRFSIVEGLPKGKIHGVSFWINKKSPVISMTTLRNCLDNFWFVLRHEIEHILNEDGKDGRPIIDTDERMVGDQIAEEEKLANAAAAEFCVPQMQMESFFDRKNPFFSEKSVLAFSSRMQVHPAIVVGQIQHRTENYGFLRRHQVSIREHIMPYAPTDGWGEIIPIQL